MKIKMISMTFLASAILLPGAVTLGQEPVPDSSKSRPRTLRPSRSETANERTEKNLWQLDVLSQPAVSDAARTRQETDTRSRLQAEAAEWAEWATRRQEEEFGRAINVERQQAQSFGPSNFQQRFINPVPNQRDSKLMKINSQFSQQISVLVKQLKSTKGDTQKQELKTQLSELLAKQYDAYLDHHEEPLKQLEARLEKLREDFEARKTAKTDLVKLRLDTIWYDAIGLGWPNSNANNRNSDFSQLQDPFRQQRISQTPFLTLQRESGPVEWQGPSQPTLQRKRHDRLEEESKDWIDDNEQSRRNR